MQHSVARSFTCVRYWWRLFGLGFTAENLCLWIESRLRFAVSGFNAGFFPSPDSSKKLLVFSPEPVLPSTQFLLKPGQRTSPQKSPLTERAEAF